MSNFNFTFVPADEPRNTATSPSSGRWADAEEIFVPKIGLADGLIHALWEEVKEKEIGI